MTLDKKFWEKYFEVYDVLNEFIPYQELMQNIVDVLDVKKGDKILDAGSGTGNLAVILEKKGAKVVGMDFSPEGVARHKKKIPNAELYIRDLTKPLPFASDSFDKIVSNNVLYTISKSKRLKVFKELYRVLKPGGKIVSSNVVLGFKPFSIYKEHIKKEMERSGIIKIIFKLFKFLVPTFKMFYYNKKIKEEFSKKTYNFLKEGEQNFFLRESNFKVYMREKKVYAGQGRLIVGKKI